MYLNREIVKNIKKGILLAILKKKGTMVSEEHRNLNLKAHASKYLLE